MALSRFFSFTSKIRKHYHAIEMVSGGLLVTIGVLIFTGQLTVIVRYLQPYLPVY
jgi:cytochrome c-type biogenesis protein